MGSRTTYLHCMYRKLSFCKMARWWSVGRQHIIIETRITKYLLCVAETINNLFILFYANFWVIPRRLNFICRHFGTLCFIFIGRSV